MTDDATPEQAKVGRDDEVVILSSVCGRHFDDDCASCQSAKASNDDRLAAISTDDERLLDWCEHRLAPKYRVQLIEKRAALAPTQEG